MCGITAYIGNKNACQVLIEGLMILQNRGYDSAGISTIGIERELITTKYASQNTTSDSLSVLRESLSPHDGAKIGIGHTRWATHGPRTDINSHPHNDISGRFSLVHNGVIENHNQIRDFLKSKEIECISDTDTEVIVQLIYWHSTQGVEFVEAVKNAISYLEGTWGLVILDRKNPHKLIAARHGSPLLIGLGQDEVYAGSEIAAFQKWTTQYIALKNNEIAVVTYDSTKPKGDKITLSLSESDIQSRINQAEKEDILSSPDPYEYWTEREIYEQPFSIRAAINNGGRIYNDSGVVLGGLTLNKDRLLKIKNLIVVGCGTSRHAGLYASDIFREISGFETVQVVDGSEFNSAYLESSHLGILVLSQSGETKDVVRCLEMIQHRDDIVSFSVVNRVGSQVARMTKCGVYLNAGREVAVASTKAFTSQVTVLTMVAIWFAQNRNISLTDRTDFIESVMRLNSCYSSVLSNKTTLSLCKDVSNYLKDKTTCFILGKGLGSYIAYEGALKIKEIGYLHAEGYPGGCLKHGPFALIEPGTPIIVILLNDNDRSYMESTISEIKSREAYTVVITDIAHYDKGDINIHISENGPLSSLLAVIPLQLMSLHLSVLKGINPDKPRNLAKCVSVI